jgi:GT2 family glycosyltransferase
MRLSVIVPVYNGASFLRASLAALAGSSHRDYELLVVDDGSTDESAAVASAAGATVLTLAERGGPARARNHAARVATGDVLVFIDADVCVHADTLARIDAHLRANPETVAVMGSYDDSPADPGFVSQYKNLFHHYIHQHSRQRAWTFWAGCGAIRRDVFLAAGGFDDRYDRPCIEDIELGARLAAQGQRIDLDPAIQAKHLKRWTLRNLIRTDVFDRAVPWLTLMLRTRHMPPDLNVTHAHRASVVLACLAAMAAVAIPVAAAVGSSAVVAAAFAVLAACCFGLLVLNLDLYRFFARKRGWPFALKALALHWFYYLYCAAGVVLAVGGHLARPAAATAPNNGVPR